LRLSGTWAIWQFRILIDEREEAKRNFEQLKAEIGSTNSGLGEPSNGPSNTKQKSPTAIDAETSEIQFVSTLTCEVELAAYTPRTPHRASRATFQLLILPLKQKPNQT
jgi:hypothetical protein